jgi:hypothetical protein
MYCQNCGAKNTNTASFCIECGVSLEHSKAPTHSAHQAHAHQATNKTSAISAKHPATLRVIITLYVIAYIIVILFSCLIWWAESQTSTVINAQSSYITCANGTKYSYSQLNIYNPATDYNGDASTIDSACGNTGGNTYSNVTSTVRQGKNPPIWYGFIAFGIGMAIIEACKAGLMFITQGYVPEVGSFSRKQGK